MPIGQFSCAFIQGRNLDFRGLPIINNLFREQKPEVTVVKVHGVFPCSRIFFASSQRFQFH